MGFRRFFPVLVVVPAAVALAHCTPPSRRGGTQEPPPPPPPTAPATFEPPPAALPPPPVTAQPEPARAPPIFRLPRPRPSATTSATASAAPPPAASTAPPVATVAPPPASSCGSVDVDGVVVPLDCWTKDYAKLDGASKAAMRQAFASASTTPPPDYVDHRRDKLEGPVRHQRSVGAGSAFALAGVIDQALLHAGVSGAAVSVQQLWGRAPRSNFGAIASASLGRGVAAESTLAYDEALACTWATGDAARLCKAAEKGRAPRADELAKAEQTPLAKLVDVVEIDGTNRDQLRDTLAKNQDVLLVIRVEPEAWRSVVKSQDTEPLIPDYVGLGSVHTVTVVGYAKQEGQWFFLLKNSWGPSWGAGGYAWISEGALKKNVIEAYVVQATSATAAAASPPTTCPEGQVPDAVSKVCAPACPDKSPRTSGVCPDTTKGGCAPGFVNVTGHCVVAAPDKQGSDPTTGLTYACGAAGCTYGWKKGTLGCTQATCSLSCPAPKFLAAVNVAKKTISCTE